MTIVITMAGLGTRFHQHGRQVPKHEIEVCGKTLFEWSLSSLAGYQSTTEEFLFISLRQDEAGPFIQKHCAAMGIGAYRVLELATPTDGQATTAMQAAGLWNKTAPLLIYNIDTYVQPGEMNGAQLRGDGFIPCFLGEGEHWSFVQLDETGRATQVREKQRISPFCTLGAYYFRTAALYEQLYTEYYALPAHVEKGERYVAPLYNHLIAMGRDVFICCVDAEKVHPMGTPEELRTFEAGFGGNAT